MLSKPEPWALKGGFVYLRKLLPSQGNRYFMTLKLSSVAVQELGVLWKWDML